VKGCNKRVAIRKASKGIDNRRGGNIQRSSSVTGGVPRRCPGELANKRRKEKEAPNLQNRKTAKWWVGTAENIFEMSFHTNLREGKELRVKFAEALTSRETSWKNATPKRRQNTRFVKSNRGRNRCEGEAGTPTTTS